MHIPKFVGQAMLFPSPVYEFQVDNHEELNRKLLEDSHAMRETTKGVVRSNQHGWHSETTLFRRPEASFQELGNTVLRSLVSATKAVAPSFDFANHEVLMQAWVNISEQGAYNTPHDHPGFCWSGCYYVRVPENSPGRSGDIEFLDPRTNISAMAVPGSNMFAPKIRFKPKDGLLLIFPSYLRHWVYPNEQNEERVSIAFNAKFVAPKKQAADSKFTG
jgi:uncharacterized protein (TIGR02466 family)